MDQGYQRFKNETLFLACMPARKDVAQRSIEIITELQDTAGGFMATRPDDAYPFVYPRDGVAMTIALNRNGLRERSMKFYRFLNSVERRQGEVFQRYHDGRPSVSQNDEFDVSPMVVQGVYDTYRTSGDRAFLEEMWPMVKECATFSAGTVDPSVGLVFTGRAVHETHELEQGFEIWTNSAAARGLLDASKVASELGHSELAADWRTRSEALQRKMAEVLYDRETGVFIKNLRRDGTRIQAPDVAQLSPFYFGICADDAILRKTLDHLRETLWNKEVGGFMRFRDFEVVQDWHWYTGGTGGLWPFFTLWAARLYRKLGMAAEADECIDFVHRAMTTELEIPEKVAPIAGYQAWKENEKGFNARLIHGMKKVESGKFRISIPGYSTWGCPLGWAHAEYLLLDAEPEILERDLAPELTVKGVRRAN